MSARSPRVIRIGISREWSRWKVRSALPSEPPPGGIGIDSEMKRENLEEVLDQFQFLIDGCVAHYYYTSSRSLVVSE